MTLAGSDLLNFQRDELKLKKSFDLHVPLVPGQPPSVRLVSLRRSAHLLGMRSCGSHRRRLRLRQLTCPRPPPPGARRTQTQPCPGPTHNRPAAPSSPPWDSPSGAQRSTRGLICTAWLTGKTRITVRISQMKTPEAEGQAARNRQSQDRCALFPRHHRGEAKGREPLPARCSDP